MIIKNITQHDKTSSLRAFTIVELAVVIVISLLLVGAIASFMTGITSQFAVSSVRGKLNNQLTTATNRIENDIQYSRYVLLQNDIADSAAPSGANHWSSSDHQLVLGSTARRSNNTPLGDIDTVDNIVYYVKDGVLYRRLLANTTSGNRYTTVTCAQTAQGGCPKDTMIADHVASVSFLYYSEDNAPVTDYSYATSIKIAITLKIKQSHQTITASTTLNAPLLSVQQGGSKNYPGIPGKLLAGPGGLTISQSNISGGDVVIDGKLNITTVSKIGTSSDPATISVNNNACTISGEWPRACAPNTGLFVSQSNLYGTLCATNESSNSFVIPASGFISNCTAPPPQMPVFDRLSFYESMPVQTPTAQSCTGVATQTLPANKIYLSSYNSQCKLTIEGNLYVKGDFTLSTVSDLYVSESATKPLLILVEGSVYISQSKIHANSKGIGVDFISFKSTNTSCNITPSCVSIPAADRKSSSEATTISVTTVSNATSSSFYSYFGNTYVSQSETGPLAGQSVSVQTVSTVHLH